MCNLQVKDINWDDCKFFASGSRTLVFEYQDVIVKVTEVGEGLRQWDESKQRWSLCAEIYDVDSDVPTPDFAKDHLNKAPYARLQSNCDIMIVEKIVPLLPVEHLNAFYGREEDEESELLFNRIQKVIDGCPITKMHMDNHIANYGYRPNNLDALIILDW